MESELEDLKKTLESAKSEVDRLGGVIKHFTDLIDRKVKDIQFKCTKMQSYQ